MERYEEYKEYTPHDFVNCNDCKRLVVCPVKSNCGVLRSDCPAYKADED